MDIDTVEHRQSTHAFDEGDVDVADKAQLVLVGSVRKTEARGKRKLGFVFGILLAVAQKLSPLVVPVQSELEPIITGGLFDVFYIASQVTIGWARSRVEGGLTSSPLAVSG